MAWNDNDDQTDEQKKQQAAVQYNQNQADAYKRMQGSYAQPPAIFQKIKDYFSKKKQDDDSQE